jgi:hypothetical protein
MPPDGCSRAKTLATDAIYMARLFVKGGYTYDIRQEHFIFIQSIVEALGARMWTRI